jgi:hypothetical protein
VSLLEGAGAPPTEVTLLSPPPDTDVFIYVKGIGWVCDGSSLFVSVIDEFPPVIPTEYVLPAPIINLSVKFGVPLLPLHKDQFKGIDTIEPDHSIIPPIGISLL